MSRKEDELLTSLYRKVQPIKEVSEFLAEIAPPKICEKTDIRSEEWLFNFQNITYRIIVSKRAISQSHKG